MTIKEAETLTGMPRASLTAQRSTWDALAYIGAQSESCLLTGESQAIAELTTNWREDFTFTLHGVTVRYDVEFSDCAPDSSSPLGVFSCLTGMSPWCLPRRRGRWVW